MSRISWRSLHHGSAKYPSISFGKLLKEDDRNGLDASAGHIEMTFFPYFVMKKAPVSQVESLMNYPGHDLRRVSERGRPMYGSRSWCPPRASVRVSKKISDYGAHNQRSHITVTAKLNEHMWLEGIDRRRGKGGPPARCTAY